MTGVAVASRRATCCASGAAAGRADAREAYHEQLSLAAINMSVFTWSCLRASLCPGRLAVYGVSAP